MSFFKTLLLLFLLPLFTSATAQQNLLVNGDFEDINNCAEYHSECGVEAWFYMAQIKAQLSYANNNDPVLGNNSLTVFYNWNGSGVFYPVIGTILPCRLQTGHRYTFTGVFSAKLNNRLTFKPGVALGENFYVPRRPFSQNITPDSIIQIRRTATTDLYKFEYSFTANGNERYLTFGTYIKSNLKLIEEDLNNGKRFNIGQQETISLMMDHFLLTADDPTEVACTDYAINKQSIYAYDYRHRDMDYALYDKGELPVTKMDTGINSLTRQNIPLTPAILRIKKSNSDTLLLGDVLFGFNEAGLKPAATEILRKTFLQTISGRAAADSISVEGHTDAIGSEPKNMILSRQRCQSVKDWLLKEAILPADKISIHPFGKSRPVSSNNTAQGRALNRRVELIIFYKL